MIASRPISGDLAKLQGHGQVPVPLRIGTNAASANLYEHVLEMFDVKTTP